MTQPTIAQLHNLTDRAAHGLTADEQQRLRDGIDRLTEYENTINWMTTCTGCARVLDSCVRETERANEAERRLRNIANGHPRADSIQAEIGEMILQTHELRDQLRATEAVVGRVRAALASFDGRGILSIGHVNLDVPTAGEVLTAVRAALDGEQPGPAATQATEAAGVHRYLSTGCWHGDHAYCQSMTGLNGAKRPASCKFCQAACQCECHREAAQPAPLTPDEEARIAQSGIDTPGCDCGHDGMGVSWHRDDCLWRRGVVDCPGRPAPA